MSKPTVTLELDLTSVVDLRPGEEPLAVSTVGAYTTVYIVRQYASADKESVTVVNLSRERGLELKATA